MAGATGGQPMTARIDQRDQFGVGERILVPSLAGGAPVPAISENNMAFVGAILSSGEPPYVAMRSYDFDKRGTDGTLSRPELGPVAAAGGFDVAADRGGSAIAGWVQGTGAERRIVAGLSDRPPGVFVGYTSTRCCRGPLPTLAWQMPFELWGALRFEVLVDGVPAGQSRTTTLALTQRLKSGTHSWQARASDIRGQTSLSRTRTLRVDAAKPLLSVGYKRQGRVVRINARARDDTRRGPFAAGLHRVVVSWGDRTPVASGRFAVRSVHRYRRKGTYTLRIVARDRAGNQTVDERTLRIG